ncbi:MAG: RNA-binding protein [Alphaproteobacteria bacterium]
MTERRCLFSRETVPTDGMIRFVVSPDDVVTPDIRGRLPGRGMWVTADRAALIDVCDKGQFNRGAKRKVTVPDALPDMVADLLEKRVLELMSLARRAGQIVMGFDSCRSSLRSKKLPALYLHALDVSDDGKDKLLRITKAREIIDLPGLTAEQQGRVWGGSAPVMHQVVYSGGLSRQIRAELGRWHGVRNPDQR